MLGRKIEVPCAAKGVARFGFDALCARPLGASDYLALAARYHTLIIEQVPELVPALHNEARRFITLIDTLYESKTKLILGAAAAPERLYREGTRRLRVPAHGQPADGDAVGRLSRGADAPGRRVAAVRRGLAGRNRLVINAN